MRNDLIRVRCYLYRTERDRRGHVVGVCAKTGLRCKGPGCKGPGKQENRNMWRRK